MKGFKLHAINGEFNQKPLRLIVAVFGLILFPMFTYSKTV